MMNTGQNIKLLRARRTEDRAGKRKVILLSSKLHDNNILIDSIQAKNN